MGVLLWLLITFVAASVGAFFLLTGPPPNASGDSTKQEKEKEKEKKKPAVELPGVEKKVEKSEEVNEKVKNESPVSSPDVKINTSPSPSEPTIEVPEISFEQEKNEGSDSESDSGPKVVIAEDLNEVKPINKTLNSIQRNRNAGKRNSTSTIYLRGTPSKPNILDLLRCISASIRHVIKPMPINEEDNEDRPEFSVFDERLYPLQEEPDVPLDELPSPEDILLFIGTAFKAEDVAPESAVMMRVYIERLQEQGLEMYPYNWRRVVLSTLILGSKVWEDFEVWNADFQSVLPKATSRDLARLEKIVLALLEYKVSVSASQYAHCYFEMRAFAQAGDSIPEEPLDKETAMRLEARTQAHQDKTFATLEPKTKRRMVASVNFGAMKKTSSPAIIS